MKTFSVLALTAVESHKEGESIYNLLGKMAKDPRCKRLCVASRLKNATKPHHNDYWFNFPGKTIVYATDVDSTFVYSSREWLDNSKCIDINDFDWLFLRADRFDDRHGEKGLDETADFFSRLKETGFPENRVINRPSGILETGSKAFLEKFEDLCPEMAICRTIKDVASQASCFASGIVLKPLDGYGGSGLYRVDSSCTNAWQGNTPKSFETVREQLEKNLKLGPMLAMRFLERVREGDKRVVVVCGEILGATLRTPAEEAWLCNLSQGGTATPEDVDDSEREIAERISPELTKKGVVIYGFDTLVDDNGKRVLSEINTLNVGGLIQSEKEGKQVVARASELVFDYMEEN